MRPARQALGDPQHQTPIDHDPQLGRHREHDLLLQLAERHHDQPRSELMSREQRGDLADLLLGRARQNRVAVKMNQQHRAAAAHHAIRGDRRIDAARQQARHAAARSSRHAARGRLFAEEIERAVRQHLDVHGKGGVLEIDAPAPRLLDDPAHFAFDLRRRERQPLVGTRGRDAERVGLTAAQVGENCGRQRAEVVRAPIGVREVRDAEHPPQPIPHLVPRRVRSQLELDPAGNRSHRRHVQPGERAFDIANQQLNEPRAVLALQRKFLVVNNDRLHESGNWVIW